MRIPHRLQFIKYTVLTGLFFSILLSYNLWAGQRYFPKTPLFDNLSTLAAPYDYIHLVVLLSLLFFSFISSSKTPIVLLILFSVYLCIDDQNRLQPWFYNYILILAIWLFYKKRVDEPNNYTTVFISIQVLVALVYVFSGLQKINSHFVPETFSWMISPLSQVLNPRQMDIVLHSGKLIPYIEILLGVGILIKPARYIVLPLIVMMHVFILLMLGPIGKSYNFVVWPWNVMMIILNLLLFASVKLERFFDISFLFKGICFYIVITLMLIFPFFSFLNKYDSYLSSSLYSGNTHGCRIILSDNAYRKLPYYIRNFVTTDADYNILQVKKWALSELHAPCIPEYRAFETVYEYILYVTQSTPNEVHFEFIEREKLFNL